MGKMYSELEDPGKKGCGRTALNVLSMAIVAALSATPAFAAPPACVVKAQVAPHHLTVPEGDMVRLNAQPSQNATSYLWEQIAGSAVTVSDPTSVSPFFTAPVVDAAGASVVFLLTVTGCSDATAGMTTTVHVSDVAAANQHPTAAANQPPTAAAMAIPDPVQGGGTVMLDGTASSDPDTGDKLSYSWTQLTGTPVGLQTDSSGAIATFTAPNAGSYGGSLKFALRVTDAGGLTGDEETVVNVQRATAAPVSEISGPPPADSTLPATSSLVTSR